MNIIKFKRQQLNLPKYVYLLVTNDKYELPVSCCDTLKQMSNETGIPFTQLYHSYYRKESCSRGMYRVHKVDISEPEEDNFNFDNYNLFCEFHNLKPCEFVNLVKYKRICNIFK